MHFLPESPRVLILRGQREEAKKTLHHLSGRIRPCDRFQAMRCGVLCRIDHGPPAQVHIWPASSAVLDSPTLPPSHYRGVWSSGLRSAHWFQHSAVLLGYDLWPSRPAELVGCGSYSFWSECGLSLHRNDHCRPCRTSPIACAGYPWYAGRATLGTDHLLL